MQFRYGFTLEEFSTYNFFNFDFSRSFIEGDEIRFIRNPTGDKRLFTWIRLYINHLHGEEYTVSFDIKINSGDLEGIVFSNSSGSRPFGMFVKNSPIFQRVSVPFKKVAHHSDCVYIVADDCHTGVDYSIKNIVVCSTSIQKEITIPPLRIKRYQNEYLRLPILNCLSNSINYLSDGVAIQKTDRKYLISKYSSSPVVFANEIDGRSNKIIFRFTLNKEVKNLYVTDIDERRKYDVSTGVNTLIIENTFKDRLLYFVVEGDEECEFEVSDVYTSFYSYDLPLINFLNLFNCFAGDLIITHNGDEYHISKTREQPSFFAHLINKDLEKIVLDFTISGNFNKFHITNRNREKQFTFDSPGKKSVIYENNPRDDYIYFLIDDQSPAEIDLVVERITHCKYSFSIDRDLTTIILQGEINPNVDVLKTIDEYSLFAHVVVSTYETDKNIHILEQIRTRGVKVILNDYYKYKEEMEKLGIQTTGYYQMLTTMAGLETVETPYTIKSRVDAYFSDLDQFIYEMLNTDKIISSSLYCRGIQNYMYHPSDILFGCKTEVMREIFDEAFKNIQNSFKVFRQKVNEILLHLPYIAKKNDLSNVGDQKYIEIMTGMFKIFGLSRHSSHNFKGRTFRDMDKSTEFYFRFGCMM